MDLLREIMGQDALLGLYKAEKADWELQQPVFPTYEEWKAQEGMVAERRGDEKIIRTMYEEDKAEAIGTFKSFKEWKAEYEKEWMESHATSSFVSAEMGMELTDAEVAYV